MEIRATNAPWYGGIEILIRERPERGKILVVQKLELVELDNGLIIPPTTRLRDNEAQTLMDDLWQAGLRPTEGSGSAGSLRATEKHLDDMRKIAFKKLRIE